MLFLAPAGEEVLHMLFACQNWVLMLNFLALVMDRDVREFYKDRFK